ncbi:hypothetical protein NRD16_000766 [Photobacterium damselae]|nr:hypothetical protein [Photobacterium damselae]
MNTLHKVINVLPPQFTFINIKSLFQGIHLSFSDESGNTGDVINTGKNFDFGNKPLFALSATGINDLEALSKKISQLKKSTKFNKKSLNQ